MVEKYYLVRGIKPDKTGFTIKNLHGPNWTTADVDAAFAIDADFAGTVRADTKFLGSDETVALDILRETMFLAQSGLVADAAVLAGASGTISAKLRRISADIGTLKSQVVSLNGVDRKVVAVPGTAVPLKAVSTLAKWLIATALSTNTNIVTIGDLNVLALAATRTGIALAAGQSTPLIPIADLNLVYIDAVVATEGISYMFFF